MGFWSRLIGVDPYDPAQRVLPAPYEPYTSTGGIPVADPGTPLQYWIGGTADADHMWRTQPNVRKVIGFAARNVASIPLQVFERASDTDRQRVTDHPLSRVVSSPRPRIGSYRFWESVISDGLLYDRWAVLKRPADDGGLTLSRIPAWRLWFGQDSLGEVQSAKFWNGQQWASLDLDELIFDYGYAPKTVGLSPVQTLSDLLAESADAVEYRRQVWANGARMPQWIGRSAEAGEWTGPQRDRFMAGISAYTKDGGKAGQVALIEDGMTLNDGTRMQSKDMLDLEGRKLSAVEVASAWFIAPELVGAREGNYSNVDAYRQMLYRDSLGPYITAWEQALNVGLTPDLADGRPLYIEANIEAKLRGSFQEQAAIMQSATGAPWLTRNEARALQNRPPIDGGDALIVPLNVVVGGQASPRDSGSQNRNSGRPSIKARPENHDDQHKAVVSAFFKRQRKAVLSRLGAKAGADWWDQDRWDGELDDTLSGLYMLTSKAAALSTLAAAGIDEDGYDVDRTTAFLRESAKRSAKSINATTKAQLDAALAQDDDEDVQRSTPAGVFDVAEDARSGEIAATSVTFAAAFGVTEAARQNSDRATKTWVVTSANPRPSHASMSGETVPVSSDFSNGMAWPGDASGGADEVAGCTCEMNVNIQ